MVLSIGATEGKRGSSWRACVSCANSAPASISPQASLAGAVAFIHQKLGWHLLGESGEGHRWTPGPEAGGHPNQSLPISPQPGPEETESPRSPSASLPHQALLRILLALAAFSTATAAIVIGASNFYRHRFYLRDFICDVSSKAWSWAPLSPSTPSPEEATRLHLCLSYLSMLEALFISFQVMLLGIWVLLLLASLVPLCLFCWSRSRHKKIDQKKLLEANGI
uniref:Transmembrane protein 176A n=1 Tax=Canis lupus dingo TaxID=286419 RepID=A0A8C0QWH2_CANLU